MKKSVIIGFVCVLFIVIVIDCQFIDKLILSQSLCLLLQLGVIISLFIDVIWCACNTSHCVI